MSDTMINNKIYSNTDKTMPKSTNEVTATKSSSDCIWNKEEQNCSCNEVNQKVSSEIDKILAEICKKYEKYGLTVEQLKQNPTIQYACHAKEENLAKIPQDKKEKIVKLYKEALEAAINDSIKDGKIDVKNVAKLSNDYFVALSTEWSIEGFKEAQKDTSTKHSLIQRLIETKCLPKNATIQNTSPEKLKTAVEKFYKNVLANDIKTLRYKKTENGHEAGKLLSPEDRVKTQLQTFGRLLVNSSPEEKQYFADALKHLYNENKLQGLEAIFSSCSSEKETQLVAAKMTDPATFKGITTTADPDGKYLDKDAAAKLYETAVSKQTEENREISHAKSKEAYKEWFTQNGEALKTVQDKIEKAKAEGVEPKLTEAEENLLREYHNFIEAGQVGEMTGTFLNDKLSNMFKEAHLAELNRDAYELPSYKDVLSSVNEYVENNPETFNTEVKEQFNNAMDKATNGNYSTVKSGSDAPMTPPAKRTEDSASNNAAIGFTTKKPENPNRVPELKSQLVSTEEKQTFRVEKTMTKPENLSSNAQIKEKFASANTNQDKLKLISTYFDKSPMLKLALEKYALSITKPLNLLNSLPSSARKYLANRLVQNGNLKEDDIHKLNLSFGEKQILLETYKKTQKTREEV